MKNALEDLLNRILPNSRSHGRLLALLSHLEYVGARKIAKALPAPSADLDHLEHLMEESRHAAVLRGQAEKLVEDPQDFEWARKSEAYLQAVDHGIDACLRQAVGKYLRFETYLCVSLIIEERAMQFYPLYHGLLPDGPIKGAVYSILKDEVGHLEDMRAETETIFAEMPGLMERCREVETQAYEKFFQPLLSELVGN